jgi:hypothetical protein
MTRARGVEGYGCGLTGGDHGDGVGYEASSVSTISSKETPSFSSRAASRALNAFTSMHSSARSRPSAARVISR